MKVLLRSCLYAALAVFSAAPAWAATTVEFWHAMSGELAERVNELVDKFNKSQSDYVVRAGRQGQLRRGRQQHDRCLSGPSSSPRWCR